MPPKRFNPIPFSYHQEIELEIATLTNLGLGLGRVALEGEAALLRSPAGSFGGWVVMVPFTLPGERVRARVFRNHPNYSEADLLEVLAPSPHRIAPPCPIFGTCGGCQYQHLAYSEQLAWKRRQVAELLERLAGAAFPVEPVVPSPRPYGYRSKITPHYEARRSPASSSEAPSAKAKEEPIGFLRQGTRHEIVDVPRCPIATEAINVKLPEVRAAVRERLAAGTAARAATLLLRDAGGQVATDYEATVAETLDLPGPPGRLSLRFLARDFFQNNPFILPVFVDHVRREAAAGGARYLVDAYCGSGLFALAAAPLFERVAGVEISATGAALAEKNAVANGVGNASFLAADAAAIFAGLDFPAGRAAVVIDPPRQGCDQAFLDQLLAFGPARVVYVSCDPATQMRDLRRFLAGGYRLARVQPFDLFPQTRHLECVATLINQG